MIRGVGLRGAIAVNVITMIGIGPLITIPLVVASLHGGLALWGWVVGAIIALCDGLVWAELSSRFPGSGGTYVYLREAFGRDRWGRVFAFLFNWQFIFFAPLLLASAYIGFVQYAAYFFPIVGTSELAGGAAKVGLGALVIALLYQRITSVAKVSIVLGITAVLTLSCIIAASIPHANFHQALSTDMPATFQPAFIVALGAALVFTVYDYVGYADVALIGDEVIQPNRTIPLAIILSIVLVAGLYIVMQVGVLGVVPWQTLVGVNGAPAPAAAQYVAATVVSITWGHTAALVVTALILITAFASLYGNLLGFSRIPFAAARDRIFFPVFAHLHKTGAFPNVSLLIIGGASIAAAFLTLGDVIAYLTAGIVIIQGMAQIIALIVLRAKHDRAPFRMWLFPLPAIVAFFGWAFLFYSTGNRAMLFGSLTLVAGALAFVILARVQRTWPFLAALAIACLVCPGSAKASYGHSAVIQQNGYPVFEVDHKPFFVYGAAFFYERLPKDQWRPSLIAYKAMGINTIDLYLIWNWHELSDGDYDFTGRTNPRRDLHALFSLVHELGFKTIVRPGPVIRNEWKNGGYPDWLLKRPEYNMPLHDILEGRYPATATLQNAHSDDAAAEWMNNATHMNYSTRWLTRVLTEIKPWSSDVIAIALDDDQGAYIDNQTWPAPHFQAYIKYLDSVVHGVTGPGVPTFINTYQMKVTASSPVWAWGNWYQSDAYSIGEHDRSQLEFSTGLLQTQSNYPVMASEFQAGWLQGPDENEPRAADPSNTELALGTLLQMGAHGIVNFPVQDTFNPPGYEAPFANAFYGWNAALSYAVKSQDRHSPTAKMGALLQNYGSLLAQTHRAATTAISWPVSARTPQTDIYKIAAATITTQQMCRSRAIACDLIDATLASPAQRARYSNILNPGLPNDLAAHAAPGFPADAVLLVSNAKPAYGFLVITNYDRQTKFYSRIVAGMRDSSDVVRNVRVPARQTAIIPINLRQSKHTTEKVAGSASTAASTQVAHAAVPASHRIRAAEVDAYGSGFDDTILENGVVRVIVSQHAGARAFVFEDIATHRNIFSTVGGMRDDVADPIPPSPRDYIQKYTHQLAAGTFNRSYDAVITNRLGIAGADFQYSMPDSKDSAHFIKSVTLKAGSREFTMDESVPSQNLALDAVTSTGLTVESLAQFPEKCRIIWGGAAHPFTPGTSADFMSRNGAIALYDSATGQVATISTNYLTGGRITTARGVAIVSYRYGGDEPLDVHFGYYHANSEQAAISLLGSLKGR